MTEENNETETKQKSEKETKQKSDTITIKKDQLWKYSTFVLMAIVVIGGFFVFSGDNNRGVTGNVVNTGTGAQQLSGVQAYQKYASDLGLDTGKFNDCLESDKYASHVQRDLVAGQEQGVRGTPGFIINGRLLSGAQPLPAFQEIIEAGLSGTAPGGIDAQITEEDHFKFGDKNSKVIIVEYSDFECPFCGRFYSQTFKQLEREYSDKNVALVYRHFPLSSIHPNAQKAAEASECAGEQGKFWEIHDMLFESGV